MYCSKRSLDISRGGVDMRISIAKPCAPWPAPFLSEVRLPQLSVGRGVTVASAFGRRTACTLNPGHGTDRSARVQRHPKVAERIAAALESMAAMWDPADRRRRQRLVPDRRTGLFARAIGQPACRRRPWFTSDSWASAISRGRPASSLPWVAWIWRNAAPHRVMFWCSPTTTPTRPH